MTNKIKPFCVNIREESLTREQLVIMQDWCLEAGAQIEDCFGYCTRSKHHGISIRGCTEAWNCNEAFNGNVIKYADVRLYLGLDTPNRCGNPSESKRSESAPMTFGVGFSEGSTKQYISEFYTTTQPSVDETLRVGIFEHKGDYLANITVSSGDESLGIVSVPLEVLQTLGKLSENLLKSQ